MCRSLVRVLRRDDQEGSRDQRPEYYDKGDYDKALRQLTLADEDNLEAMLLKARTYEARGEKDLARGYYTALAKKYPNSTEGIVAQQNLR
jgi:tetratricopeptide (TPR) repeat protein